jgi:hypothetical protein
MTKGERSTARAFRARPQAEVIAASLPSADEKRVAEVLLAAGSRPDAALAVICAAAARLVVERSAADQHEPLLGALRHQIGQQVLLRRQRPGGRG